jgi:hypothetical protein
LKPVQPVRSLAHRATFNAGLLLLLLQERCIAFVCDAAAVDVCCQITGKTGAFVCGTGAESVDFIEYRIIVRVTLGRCAVTGSIQSWHSVASRRYFDLVKRLTNQ